MLGDQDTIAAISTAKGIGALSIVRISGPKTDAILAKCFTSTSKAFETHRAYYGYWCDGEPTSKIDQVLVLYFDAGKGFTGEKAIEIICHGGIEVTNLILSSCLRAEARLARPGEFTYRAVMNDKIDLAQAEGILEIIQAKTPRGAALALKNIEGALSKKLQGFETDVTFLLANLEASIDFTTEDIQPVKYPEMLLRLNPVIDGVTFLLKTYLPGRVMAQGLRTILAGKPNVGKSSLLNALLEVDRCIVHDAPGTTRDTIEAEVLFRGHLFRLVDTAGLRDTQDEVESQGVNRTYEEITKADIIIYTIDSVAGMTNADVAEVQKLESSKVVICFNKSDLKKIDTKAELQRFGLDQYFSESASCAHPRGCEALREKLISMGQTKGLGGEVDVTLSTQRQEEALSRAERSLENAAELLKDDASPDLVSLSLRDALASIQAAQGKCVEEDVMDRVFKEFCIGK